MILFPFADFWWFYLGFSLFVLTMLIMDLGVFHRTPHKVTFRESAGWSIFWIVLALIFNFLFYRYCLTIFSENPMLLAQPGFDPNALAKQLSLEFLTGFVIEKALAVDNIFVFVVVFSFFSIPAQYQHRVLFFGIIGALVFRAIFIAIGALLMQHAWVVVLFGVFLIATGAKMLVMPETKMNPGDNVIIRFLKKKFRITDSIDGPEFFVRKSGLLFATPLFVALIFIEITDIIFAVDSVPAIFAVTKEPLIVFTSNIFAIMGLRSLYFMLAGVVDKFHLLRYGLALVLIFVGCKMSWLNQFFDGHFPILLSLTIILALVGGSIAASFLFPKKVEQAL